MNALGWVTYKEVVDDIMLAWGDASDHGQFMRLLNFAIQAYENLRLHDFPATKPVTLSISTEMRAIILPDDFLKFVSVGVMSDGRFYPFQPKSDAVANVDDDCGIGTREVPDGFSESGDVLTRYTVYYTLDLDNRRILIEGPLNLTEAILNYTPTGVKLDGITYIPRMCRAVIKADVEHKWVIRDKNRTAADRVIFEREYIKEMNKFRGLQYNVDEIFEEYYIYISISKQY